jgi:hypothetical protein
MAHHFLGDHMAWRFVGFSYDIYPFEIEGINVWEHKWLHASNQRAAVVDPKYGQEFNFQIWKIEVGDRHIRFAAGEFSSNAWGFYQEEPGEVAPSMPAQSGS